VQWPPAPEPPAPALRAPVTILPKSVIGNHRFKNKRSQILQIGKIRWNSLKFFENRWSIIIDDKRWWPMKIDENASKEIIGIHRFKRSQILQIGKIRWNLLENRWLIIIDDNRWRPMMIDENASKEIIGNHRFKRSKSNSI
jgi:hypothetical protein